MSLRITFDIFSGRANPAFELDGADAAAVLDQLKPARKRALPSQLIFDAPHLGYRGLIVEQVNQKPSFGLPTRFLVAAGILSAPDFSYEATDPLAETFVLAKALSVGASQIQPETAELIREGIANLRAPKSSVARSEIIEVPPVKCACAPVYEPAWWNDALSGGAKQFYNNCYNYACNYRSDTFAQPGRATGAIYPTLTCAGVKPAAIRDALVDVPASPSSAVQPIKCPDNGHLVALVTWPNADFHWYRMGPDGYWSHKPGGTAVTNVDNSGKLITDPRTADRGGYTAFCGFLIVRHGHIKIN